MLQVEIRLLDVVALAVAVGSLAGWAVAAQRLGRGESIMRYEPRRWVPWGAIDLGLILFVLLSLQLAAITVVRFGLGIPLGDLAGDDASVGTSLRQQASAIFVFGSANLLTLSGAVTIVRLRAGANTADLGIDRRKTRRDLALAVVTLAMVAVPVLLIQLALTQAFPTQHPLVKMLQEDPDPRLFAAAAFAAVLVAPIAEEYLFRVFIQGWLENVFCVYRRQLPGTPSVLREDVGRLVLGGTRPKEAGPADEQPPAMAPSEPPLRSDPATHGTSAAGPWPCAWPIVISSGLFAAMHLGHGPDPIPLFFLALGLGYVYQRTHRVLPCIVMHMLFNAFALVQLWMMANQPAA